MSEIRASRGTRCKRKFCAAGNGVVSRAEEESSTSLSKKGNPLAKPYSRTTDGAADIAAVGKIKKVP